MNILAGAAPLIVDVRQTGSGPGDVGAPQRMRRHTLDDAGRASQATHGSRGVVGLHRPAPLVAQQRSRVPAVDGLDDYDPAMLARICSVGDTRDGGRSPS